MSRQNASSGFGHRLFLAATTVLALAAILAVGLTIFRNRQQHAAEPSLGKLLPSLDEPGDAPFDLRDPVIPLDAILAGGPPKDGIPALTKPTVVPAATADYLRDDDRVIGIGFDGLARAYPLRILDYHEVVNDTLGDRDVAVTYCPLCDSAAVFDRRVNGAVREFGVSGLLYNSNVLLYNRHPTSEGLWSQLMRQGVSGAGSQKPLDSLPFELTTWSGWKERYPQTDVLSVDTGHDRDYRVGPYGGYFSTDQLMFPVAPSDKRMPPKTPVLGAWAGDVARAYPLEAFGDEAATVADALGDHQLKLAYDPKSRSLRVAQADEGVRWMYAFWFAWYAFNPQTEVYGEEGRRSQEAGVRSRESGVGSQGL